METGYYIKKDSDGYHVQYHVKKIMKKTAEVILLSWFDDNKPSLPRIIMRYPLSLLEQELKGVEKIKEIK